MSTPSKNKKPTRSPDDFARTRDDLLKQLHDATSKKDKGRIKAIRASLSSDDLVP
jgi:hypothetical protein